MYGTGARLTEAHQLRVKDIDFDLVEIEIRDGKGAKDRRVMLPNRISAALRRQISTVTGLHEQDRRNGGGWAQLPGALHRKDPRGGYDIGWQFLFPSSRWSSDPATGRKGRQGGPSLRTGVMLIKEASNAGYRLRPPGPDPLAPKNAQSRR